MRNQDKKARCRKSIRLKNYDYSSAGAYFVTICARDGECLFGMIKGGEMALNDAGIIVDRCWRDISAHYPNAISDVYVIMPNHVHGIISIVNDTLGANNHSPLQRPCGTSRSIGAIVRGFKIGVTKWMRTNSRERHIWQRNYYEHVIRGENDLARIREYIVNNPAKWQEDEYYVPGNDAVGANNHSPPH